MDPDQTYSVSRNDNTYCVIDSNGRTVISCPNAPTAEHYADLLNKAYRSGFKAGYKAGKHATK